MTDGHAAMLKALSAAFLLLISPGLAIGQSGGEIGAFQRANISMKSGSWTDALRQAEGSRPAARTIIEWHQLRNGEAGFDAVQSFVTNNPDWPGLKLIRRRAEANLPGSGRADEVIAFFADQPPQTSDGVIGLIDALRATDQAEEAEKIAVRTWLTMVVTKGAEDKLLARYGDALAPFHESRLDMLLWRGADDSAERMLPRVGKAWTALARARLALRDGAAGVDSLIEAVPDSLADHPGLAFERMQWRARKGRNEGAIDLFLATNSETLGEPSRWAGWRRSFARAEMRAGRIDNAYRLAAEHGLGGGASFADLEWLAGYIALTYKRDGETALRHFLRFRGAVATPISLGRAGYWEGRAHELLGDTENAALAYAFGAEYQTSFYGLLAAERGGLQMDPSLTGAETFPDWKTTSLVDSTVFKAAQLFISVGERNQAERFLRHLTETISRDEIGALGNYLISVDEPHLAVMVGKQAARRGIVVPSAYYPLVNLKVRDMPVPEELALAIARRESEFDPIVTSGVGARGLMQLMPATARAVAKYLDLSYSRERLLSDPAYNARLGATYLDELMETFDGNIVMVSAGYNAGPSRPIRWMRNRGDPRQGDIDIVDWIEHIPFNETRNYVMRVAESLPVYRARITGQTSPLEFRALLTARPGHERQATKGDILRPKPRPAPLTD